MKRFIAMLLTLCMLFSVFSYTVSAVTVTDSTTGVTVSRNEEFTSIGNYGDDLFVSNKTLSDVPHTFEAWVKLPDGSTSNSVVYGNYDQTLTHPVLCVGVKSQHPRIYWYDDFGNIYDVTFESADVATGSWSHMAITLDSDGYLKCYVDGELIQTKYFYPDFDPNVINRPFRVAGDARRLNSSYFKGELAGVAVYSDVRTAAEIKVDMTAPDTTDSKLLASYDLTDTEGKTTIEDESMYGVDVTYTPMWLTEEEMETIRDKDFEYDYSFAVIGDTQCTTYDNPEKLHILYDWLADNADSKKLKYVIGVGDITDHNTVAEWEAAQDAITRLDGKVEYSLVRGNHDWISASGTDFENLTKYFGNNSWYTSQYDNHGGYYDEGSLNNTWRTIRMGNTDWLLLNLDFGAPDGVLEWACDIVEAHPNHRVIISTHAYLDCDYDWLNRSSKYSTENAYNASLNNGDDIWDKLVSRYENIDMIFCGHMMYDELVTVQRKGIHGNTVTEMLVDCQGPDRTLKSLGMVAMYYVNEKTNDISVEYYSTNNDLYFKTINQFTFNTEAEGDNVRPYVSGKNTAFDGEWVQPLGQGTKESPYLISEGGNLVWMQRKIGATTGNASFDGIYFKQTNDIDLNGRAIKSIGYQYNGDANKMYAFGGIYDGNGYSIKNGTITTVGSGYAFNRSYGYGLFGCIYGADIKNVTLDNITVVGRGVTGSIVGIAAAPQTGTSVTVNYSHTSTTDTTLKSDTRIESNVPADFNTIYNCHVKDNCKIITLVGEGQTATINGYDNYTRAGMVGGIAGMVYGTTVSYCTSDIEFTVSHRFVHSGGIAASAGLNSVIDHCSFTGGINLCDMVHSQTSSVGGIVGMLTSTWITSSNDLYYNIMGGVKITNCYNSGYFKSLVTTTKTIHYGGIVGYAGSFWRGDLYASEDVPESPRFLVSNCHNLFAESTSGATVKAGIVGKADSVGQSAYNKIAISAVMWLKDCYSVDVAEKGETATISSNEYRNQNRTNSYGQYGVTVIPDADGNSTVGTKTETEIKTYTSAIDADIKEVKEAKEESSYVEPTEKYDDFSTTFEDEIIGSDALLVTLAANGAEKGQKVAEKWNGKTYTFYAGINAFTSVADAVSYAYANGIDTPDVIVTSLSEGSTLTVERPANIYAPNYNTKPFVGGDNLVATKDYAKAWTDNADYFDSQIIVKDIVIDEKTSGGIVGIYGFTFTGVIKDTARAENIKATKITIKNVVKNGTDASNNAYLYQPTNANTKQYSLLGQKDELNIVNFYIKKAHTGARLIGEWCPAYTTFDGLFVDGATANFGQYPTWVKSFAMDSVFTIKNSNIQNWADFTPEASKIGVLQLSGNNALDLRDGSSVKVVFDNNIIKNFAGSYGADLRPYVIRWYANSISDFDFSNNYLEMPVMEACTNAGNKDTAGLFYSLGITADNKDSANYGKVTVKNNLMNGVSGALLINSGSNYVQYEMDITDNFTANDWSNNLSTVVGSVVAASTGHENVIPGKYWLDSDMTLASNVIHDIDWSDMATVNASEKTVEIDYTNTSIVDIAETESGYTYTIDLTSLVENNKYNKFTVAYGDTKVNMTSSALSFTVAEKLTDDITLDIVVTSNDGETTENWTAVLSTTLMDVITGNAGANATYSFDPNTAVLTITGTGTLWSPGLEAAKRPLVKEVVVEGITSISANIFSGAHFTSLEKVTLPEGLTSLGKGAFTDCKKLSDINLPTTLTSIGELCFYNCKSLTKIDIPENVTSIGNSAFLGVVASDINFAGTRAMWDAVTIGTENARLSFVACSDDYRVILDKATKGDAAWIFNEANETLYFAGNTSFIKSYAEGAEMVPAEIAVKVKYIDIDETLGGFGAYTFSNMTNVISVTGGENIRYVGNYAFKNCSNLKSVSFTNSQYFGGIPYGLFANCTSLETVELSDSIVFLYGASFQGCTSLKEITIPAGAKAVGEYTFRNCTALETITLHEGITSFGAGAIQGCTSLKTINFPSTLKTIGQYAFYNVPSTLTVNFNGTQSQWNTVYVREGNTTLNYLKVSYK